jgi:hypothetical protein
MMTFPFDKIAGLRREVYNFLHDAAVGIAVNEGMPWDKANTDVEFEDYLDNAQYQQLVTRLLTEAGFQPEEVAEFMDGIQDKKPVFSSELSWKLTAFCLTKYVDYESAVDVEEAIKNATEFNLADFSPDEIYTILDCKQDLFLETTSRKIWGTTDYNNIDIDFDQER